MAEKSEQDDQKPPGAVIAYSPAETGQYIGCPGIVILPGGACLASHSFFGPGSTCDRMRVFRSEDRGETWKHAADIEGQFWSTLFLHNGALYLMGTSAEWGHVVIRRSTDCGKTWTQPRDRRTGLLLAEGRYHSAPVPVVVHRGRIWRSMEDMHPTVVWGRNFRAFVMSAPADADLLDADNWTASNRLRFDPAWLQGENPGWLEGNVVVTPEGNLVNILRVHAVPDYGKAAVAEISEDGRTVSFDPETGFIEFYGGLTKFTIRYDPVTNRYWSLVNKVTNPRNAEFQRNVLALVSSADLRNWSVESIILRHREGEALLQGDKYAFQYADWQFEGDEIVAASRTAFRDAHNFHDANYLTFHRVPGFRRFLSSARPSP
jgi:hypothetical protein